MNRGAKLETLKHIPAPHNQRGENPYIFMPMPRCKMGDLLFKVMHISEIKKIRI